MTLRTLVLVSLLTGGCAMVGEGLEPYYADGAGPSVSGLNPTSEKGNVGGGTVAIQGSGFGDDPEQLLVLFGDKNAEIIEVSDTELTVVVPGGPVEGGAVSIRVALPGGYDEYPNAYAYDIGPVYGDDPFGPRLYDDEHAFITVQNFRDSAYGRDWVGMTGIDGAAEFLEFAYPRLHTQHVGWFGGGDQASDSRWSVQTPAHLNYIWGLEDMRLRPERFKLHNEANVGQHWSTACVDADTLAPAQCSESNVIQYKTSDLHFCEASWLDSRDRGEYSAAWPVDEDFFVTEAGTGVVRVSLQMDDVVFAGGDTSVDLVMPDELSVSAPTGFSSTSGWATGRFNSCFDDEDDGDYDTTLEDTALSFRWLPSEVAIPVDGAIAEVETYVRFSVTSMSVGWFGGEAYQTRLLTVVPDSHETDTDGYSNVGMPASVFYQLPEANTTIGSTIGGRRTYADPLNPGYGYTFVSAERVTEYRLNTEEGAGVGLRGDVVLAYVTGTFGIYSVDHPFDGDTCSDCLDNDGDGWVDADDPDCDRANRDDGSDPAEDNYTFGMFTCNDGVDNDGDGYIDREDEMCRKGTSDETNCSDGIDNDGDGWIDELDGECAVSGGNESGLDTWGCSDGLDNDGDGWIDGEDPDCTRGDDEELGYGVNECNDGIDNDGHGDVDADDPYCRLTGATGDAEQPAMSGDCVDGVDNDLDGFIDANDPDCETGSFYREFQTYDPSGSPYVPTCYDGIDNNGDGLIDADDPSCWRDDPETGEPHADGFYDEVVFD